MTHDERGLYIALLCVQWSQGGLSEDDFTRIAGPSFGGCLERVKSKFPQGKDSLFRNVRLEIERAKQTAYRLSRSNNGSKGGRPRKPYGNHMVNIHKPQRKPPSPSPSPSPDSDLLTPKRNSAAPVSSEHEAFINGWVQNFKAIHGIDYAFDGGRDGKAVRDLLRLQITRLDLLEIAKLAWLRRKSDPKAWHCKQADTIHGLRDNLNNIRTEIQYGTNQQNSGQRNQQIPPVKGSSAVNGF